MIHEVELRKLGDSGFDVVCFTCGSVLYDGSSPGLAARAAQDHKETSR